MSDLFGSTAPATELEAPPGAPQMELEAQPVVVTDTWVVRAVVLSLALVTLSVVVASAWLSKVGAEPLPGELTALAPAGVGALGAMLAGTLTSRA